MNDVKDFYASSMSDEVAAILKSAIRQMSRGSDASDSIIHHLALASTALEKEKAKRQSTVFCQSHGTLNPRQLVRAKSILSENAFSANASARAAEACAMSLAHFERCFRMSAGMPPHHWIINARMERAKHLLVNGSAPIADIAKQCGYAENCHFTRIFTREVGISPGAWRRLFANLAHTHQSLQR
jgi:AraC family transcriptional regulator